MGAVLVADSDPVTTYGFGFNARVYQNRDSHQSHFISLPSGYTEGTKPEVLGITLDYILILAKEREV